MDIDQLEKELREGMENWRENFYRRCPNGCDPTKLVPPGTCCKTCNWHHHREIVAKSEA